MTPPSSPRKVVLVLAGTSMGSTGQPPLRRYRMARLRLDTPEASFPKSYEYLKRTFD